MKRSARVPDGAYFTNWTGGDDAMTRNLQVQLTGDYAVAVDYTCPIADAGSSVELSFNSAAVTGTIVPGWDSPLVTDEDRVPRPGESYRKAFHRLPLGTIHLDAGRGQLTLRATKTVGQQVAVIDSASLTLKPMAKE